MTPQLRSDALRVVGQGVQFRKLRYTFLSVLKCCSISVLRKKIFADRSRTIFHCYKEQNKSHEYISLDLGGYDARGRRYYIDFGPDPAGSGETRGAKTPGDN